MTARDIILVGAPVEEGAGRRGCLMGPDAYRTAGLAENLKSLGHTVRDLGNLVPATDFEVRPPNPVVKNFHEIAAWTRALYDCAADLGRKHAFPIYMGGDHALALGTVTGQAVSAAKLGRPLFVLWLDAHSDFHTIETTESGNLDMGGG